MQDKQDSKKHFPKASVSAPVSDSYSEFLPSFFDGLVWKYKQRNPHPHHAIETLTETLEIKHYTMSE